ncbi:MAG: GNAT family N-acetyltransferase [Halobacteriaceae archaeon]
MSTTVEETVVPAGSTDRARETWRLKEQIRREEDVLKQRRGFFMSAYRRARVHLLESDDDLLAFAVVRTDGYLLFLGVHPAHRGEGLGERLVAAVTAESGPVTCHARTTNEEALGFYEHLGFERVRRIDGYYEDGGDAYYLRLGDGEGQRLRDRLSRFLRR